VNINRNIKRAWDYIKNSLTINAEESERDLDFGSGAGVLTDSRSIPKDEMAQVTYYTCIKYFSEAMGKLPLKQYQHTEKGVIEPPKTDIYRLLSLRPCGYMNSNTFWSLQESNCQQFGNSYAWIAGQLTRKTFGGEYKVTGIYPMAPGCVTPMINDIGLFGTNNCLFYEYTNPYTGESTIFRADEVLHFKNWLTKDGILGIPTKYNLKYMLEGERAADAFLRNLYENGLSAKMVLQFASNLDDKRIGEIERKFAARLMGPQAAGKVVPIPQGLEVKPLGSSLVDNQFLENRRYTALEVAACFGIKPSMLNLYSESKYSTVETEQLAFLDTLAFRLKMYEEELNAKLLTPEEYEAGYFYEFNDRAILRTDSLTQSQILSNYTNNGVYKPDECRDYLRKPHVEGGDRIYINGSYVPLTEAGAAYKDKIKPDDGGKDK
jgi:HK97 family phage portal protein